MKKNNRPIIIILILILVPFWGYVLWRGAFRFNDREMARTIAFVKRKNPLTLTNDDFNNIGSISIGNTRNYKSLSDLKKLKNLEYLHIGYDDYDGNFYERLVLLLTPSRVRKTGNVSGKKKRKFEKELGEILASNENIKELYLNLNPGRSNITNFDFLSQNNSKYIRVALYNAQDIDYASFSKMKNIRELKLVNCDVEKVDGLEASNNIKFVFENMEIDKAFDYGSANIKNLTFKNCTFETKEPFENAGSVEDITLENCNGLKKASFGYMKNLKEMTIESCDVLKVSQIEGLHNLKRMFIYDNPINYYDVESEKLDRMRENPNITWKP